MKAMSKATEFESLNDQMQAVAFQSKLVEIKRGVRSDEIIRARERVNVRSLARNGKRVKTVEDEETLLGR